MPTRVRSYAKINLGLAIGPPRADGFHALRTLYQTLALYDHVTVSAQRAVATRIVIRSNDPRVPTDARNTAWKMVERALAQLEIAAEVVVFIQKDLPIQGGLGAGSANAAAALIGLERELSLGLTRTACLELGALVGSDVPLFFIGGAVLGSDRGQVVEPAPAVTLDGREAIPCVIALPRIGVSTPLAFREWDRRFANPGLAVDAKPPLHSEPIRDTLMELSRTYASVFAQAKTGNARGDGLPPSSAPSQKDVAQNIPENLQGLAREQLHVSLAHADASGSEDHAAEGVLDRLLRAGILNDFESVVFPQHPFLREVKMLLEGEPGSPDAAAYAALSGSGSALFGLYRTEAAAEAAFHRLRQHGTGALRTSTIARAAYWDGMFGE